MTKTDSKTRAPKVTPTDDGLVRLQPDRSAAVDLEPKQAEDLADLLRQAAGQARIRSSRHLASIRERAATGGVEVTTPVRDSRTRQWRVRLIGEHRTAEAHFTDRGDFADADMSDGHQLRREDLGLLLAALSKGLE